jgi:ATP-dependent helicase/DNAse subunit B
VAEERRRFQRAVAQATERLILSYPRADARTGRERLPSLFFVSAAAALQGRPLSGVELGRLVAEDALDRIAVSDALDPGERDRIRVRTGGREAALAIAAGSSFFRQSHLASEARWSNHLTAYDGLVHPLPDSVASRLDPVTAPYPISASRFATFARCGFLYLLEHVLRLEPALEPEERKRLDPLERGSAFHETAEKFLRELRDAGRLPVRDDDLNRARILALADQCLDELVAKSPPRFTVLWQKERARFHQGMLAWLTREAQQSSRSTPLHFEVSFGPSRDRAPGEPHSDEPLVIDLGDGRALRVSGKIDRIDRKPDGTLVLRDYKTGKAPRDDGGLFRGGRQLQIPFYLLAAEKLLPGSVVTEAFLDYVDGGRQVSLDPVALKGEGFRALLRGLVDAIATGTFVQEPTACEWCDFKAVCGPRPLIDRRRRFKVNDPRVQRVLRLRDVG